MTLYPSFCVANYWEGGPPIAEADRRENSVPILFSKLLAQRATAVIKEKDQYVSKPSSRCNDTALTTTSHRELLDGLVSRGYKLNFGEDGSGFLFLALKRAGGYYLGVLLLRITQCGVN